MWIHGNKRKRDGKYRRDFCPYVPNLSIPRKQPKHPLNPTPNLVIVRRVVESRRQSALHPFNQTPYNPSSSNPYANPKPSPNTSTRTSIMNLTKENALKAAGAGSPVATGTMVAMARTPALPPQSEIVDNEKAEAGLRKGESTRLDGRPVRRKSILGRGVGVLAGLRCWGGKRGRRKGRR
jgi:hypothetical protein